MPSKRRAGGWLTLLSGPGLAVCFLLPMVRQCDATMHPYQEAWPFWSPHLFGFLAAAIAAIWLLGRQRVPAALAWPYWLFTTAAALGLGYAITLMLHDEKEVRTRWVLALAVWAALLLPLVHSLKLRRDPTRWPGRVTWAGALLCTLYFALYGMMSQRILYGLWLSLAACALLVAGGALSERPE